MSDTRPQGAQGRHSGQSGCDGHYVEVEDALGRRAMREGHRRCSRSASTNGLPRANAFSLLRANASYDLNKMINNRVRYVENSGQT